MSAKELLQLPPAEWSAAVETMSWRELRDVAEKMIRVARRVNQLRQFALEVARQEREKAQGV